MLVNKLFSRLIIGRNCPICGYNSPRLPLDVCFCGLQSHWRCSSNENTNGLRRQCFRTETELDQHHTDEWNAVAHALNTRPRKTRGWRTPAEVLDQLLKQDMINGAATTG
ncbi:hypothetical protein B30_16278 [Celeribacter baekdonensis B30]|uniref:Transposase n=1 Tax=Celeribacter baekdonensis B30 TaxID=1208323 RepID=K2JVU3_9RHOB|nr:hypothetical protein B30_16278 [Celeribacter baekdonensis B30]